MERWYVRSMTARPCRAHPAKPGGAAADRRDPARPLPRRPRRRGGARGPRPAPRGRDHSRGCDRGVLRPVEPGRVAAHVEPSRPCTQGHPGWQGPASPRRRRWSDRAPRRPEAHDRLTRARSTLRAMDAPGSTVLDPGLTGQEARPVDGVDNGYLAGYRVRFDEAGPDGLVRSSALLRYAQDVAWRHSEHLGFDRGWYQARGLGWVVRGLELEVREPIPMGHT